MPPLSLKSMMDDATSDVCRAFVIIARHVDRFHILVYSRAIVYKSEFNINKYLYIIYCAPWARIFLLVYP